MTSPELAEEVLGDLDLLRARDPRGLLPAVAAAGAQVRETARLTAEAGLERVTAGGRPRGLVIVARREGAVAASVLRALLGPGSPVTVDVAASELVCPTCSRAFPVRDGIPVLLLDEARQRPA